MAKRKLEKTDVGPRIRQMISNRYSWDHEIIYERKRVSYAGSCNACRDRNHRMVSEITLRGLSFRLCARCEGVLKKMLKGNRL